MVAKHVGVPSLHGFLDFGAIFDVVRTEALLVDLEVVVAFLAENVVDEQSKMGAYFVSQCFVVMCVGASLSLHSEYWLLLFLSSCSERSGCVHVSCPH